MISCVFAATFDKPTIDGQGESFLTITHCAIAQIFDGLDSGTISILLLPPWSPISPTSLRMIASSSMSETDSAFEMMLVANRFRAIGRARFDSRMEDRKFFPRLVRISEEGRDQRADFAQLLGENRDALVLAARGVIRPRCDSFEQFRDRALMHVRILPQINRRQMEAEAACCTAKRPQTPACHKPRAIQFQRLVDDMQIAGGIRPRCDRAA